MRKKQKGISKNYLEHIPVRQAGLRWEQDEAGLVTLYVHNTGWMKKLTQIVLKKPEYSQIHLDQHGSFVWSIMDGEMDILELGELVKERFGEKAEPLYPRLARFFQVLESYQFVSFRENS